MEKFKKILLQLIVLISLNLSAQSQISFINQFSASQKANYSKSISLLSYSALADLISQGKPLTILLQDDAFFYRLTENENRLLFVQHDVQAINQFFNNYCIDGLWDQAAIAAGVNANGKMLQVINKSGQPIQFSRHLNSFLVVQPNSFEANVLGSQNIVQSVFLFL